MLQHAPNTLEAPTTVPRFSIASSWTTCAEAMAADGGRERDPESARAWPVLTDAQK